MSATGRGADRPEHDFYETPAATCDAALSVLELHGPVRILDAGAGTGSWGKSARRRWPHARIEGVDLTPQTDPAYDVWHQGDFLSLPRVGTVDAVIGNPPYSLSEAFVHQALEWVNEGGSVLFLLRLNFLEGVGRKTSLWTHNPPYEVFVFPRRISFTGDGRTDATSYAMFHWKKGYMGPFHGLWL